MKSMTTSFRAIFRTFTAVIVILGVCLWTGMALGQEIDATHKYAWSENTGWQNWKATHGQAAVYATHLEGFVWAENIGWIRLGTHTGGGSHTYANDSSTTYGVNRNASTGVLSGFAWSENAGWIKFDPEHGGVTISPATGDFSGYAWGENIGWIRLAGTAQNDTPYKVKLADTAPSVTTQAVTSIGTTSATGNGNITSLGSSNPTAHGVCWNTTENPATDDDCDDNEATATTGAFTASITGLSAGTTYHVRAFATNTAGTSYGDNVSFITSSPPSPVDGQCGNADGQTYTSAPTSELCSSGTASAVSGDGPWTWTCSGSNDGSTASCSADVPSYTVTGTAGAGGSISPTTHTVNHGSTTTFTVTPNTGYIVNRVRGCGGALTGNTYRTGQIIEDCTVSAAFRRTVDPGPSYYSIIATALPAHGGEVSGGGNRFVYGQQAVLRAVAHSGFQFKAWMENSTVISTSSTFSFTVTRSRNFTAVFEVGHAAGTERGIDYNQDGRADLLVFVESSREILMGFMDGLNLLGGGLLGELPEGWQIGGTGYFNGQPGLVARHDVDEHIFLILTQGLEVTGIELIGAVPRTFTLLHVADMNGSGNWDLVFLHPDSRQIYIYHLNANLRLDEPQLLGELSPDMASLLAADLTGDGRAELILRNMARGDLFMAKTGSEGWEKTLISALPLAYEIAGRGFFNRDAMADLLIRHTPSGELWVAYMNGPAAIDLHFAGIVPVAEWRLLTVADFNGNGLSDTLWLHIPSRILYVALTGEHLLSEAGALAELPEGWEILE